jgi:hypothetical protein
LHQDQEQIEGLGIERDQVAGPRQQALHHVEPELAEFINLFFPFNHASWILLEDLRPVLKTFCRTVAEDAPRRDKEFKSASGGLRRG